MSEKDLQEQGGDKKKTEVIEQQLIKIDPKVFEGVPKQKKEQIIRSVLVSMHTLHIGPLPDPETYAQYAQIIPNGADRIMLMAEKQLDHRILMETKQRSAQMLQSNIGQILAFLIGIAALGASTYCIISGHDWSGSILGVGGLTSLVTAFIQGRKQQSNSLKAKKPK